MPGRSTGTSWSIRGATTMKMMSSTSTTSTSGVTLMSGLTPTLGLGRRHAVTAFRFRVVSTSPVGALGDFATPGSRLRFALRPVLDRVEQLAGGAVQRAFVAGDLVREVVVREHRGDR